MFFLVLFKYIGLGKFGRENFDLLTSVSGKVLTWISSEFPITWMMLWFRIKETAQI